MAELLALEAEYEDGLEALPDRLRSRITAEAPKVITDLDLRILADIKPPKTTARLTIHHLA